VSGTLGIKTILVAPDQKAERILPALKPDFEE